MPLVLAGATSGSTTVQATDAVTATITLPTTSGTLALTSGGGSPSFTTITTTNDASISGLTVGKGGGSVVGNTVLGSGAGQANTTGYITAVGYQAGYANTTGSANNAFGYAALSANTTGSFNVAVGTSALVSNTTASNNTAVGYQAGYSSVTGTPNVYVGYQAGYYQTGNYNSALGAQALYGANGTSTGGASCAIGYKALYANTTGNYNVALGNEYTGNWGAPLSSNTTGSTNIAIGTGCLASNTTNSGSTGIGYIALNSSTGGNNTAYGNQAGYYVTTGSGNILLGVAAGSATNNLTTGQNNVYIGYSAGPSASGVNNELLICSGSSYNGRGASTGMINPNGGGVYQGNNSASWSTTSDQRLKKNIVDNTDGLNKITALQVRNFEYRLPEEITELAKTDAIANTGVQLGVIAQEIQQVLPNCVKTESTGVMSVDTSNLTFYLINAVKELNTLAQTQAAQIAALTAKVGA